MTSALITVEIARRAGRLVGQALASRPFLLLLLIDSALIAVHVYVATAPWEDDWALSPWLRVDRDRSLPEFYGYAKISVACVLLLLLARRERQPAFFPVAAWLLFMLADDSLELHEKVGALATPWLPMLGELLFYGAAGAALIAWTARSYWRAEARDRATLLAIGFAVALVALFAVGIDAAHAEFIDAYGPYNSFASLVEDGGEMVALSLLLAVMIRVDRESREMLVGTA